MDAATQTTSTSQTCCESCSTQQQTLVGVNATIALLLNKMTDLQHRLDRAALALDQTNTVAEFNRRELLYHLVVLEQKIGHHLAGVNQIKGNEAMLTPDSVEMTEYLNL